jgi:hypothetical protein
VYRLYKVKNGGANKQRRNQPAANVAVPPVHRAPDVAVQQQNPPSTSSSVVASTGCCSAGTSASSAQALFAAASTSTTSTSQEQMPPLVSTGQVQQFHDQYAFGLSPLPLAAIPPPLVTVAGVPNYSQGTAPPALMMNQFGTTLSPPAAAMSPPPVVVPPPPQPVVLPPEDCNMDAVLSAFSDEEDCNMDAMLSALSDEVPAGADIILPSTSDGDQVFFSLDELCGTDCPFGDVNNNQVAF